MSGKDVIEYHKLVKSNLLLRIFAFGNFSEDTAKYFASIAKTYLPGTRMPSQRIIPQFAMPEIGKDKVFNEKVNFLIYYHFNQIFFIGNVFYSTNLIILKKKLQYNL